MRQDDRVHLFGELLLGLHHLVEGRGDLNDLLMDLLFGLRTVLQHLIGMDLDLNLLIQDLEGVLPEVVWQVAYELSVLPEHPLQIGLLHWDVHILSRLEVLLSLFLIEFLHELLLLELFVGLLTLFLLVEKVINCIQIAAVGLTAGG